MGGIGATWRFRIAKFVPFRYPWKLRTAKFVLFRYPRWRPSWNSLNNISRTASRIELIYYWRYRGDMEIQNCQICTVLTSKMAAILKSYRQHLTQDRKSDWNETWWEVSGRHGDSELLKSFRSDIEDGPWRPSWNYLNVISSLTESLIELIHYWRFRGDMAIQNC